MKRALLIAIVAIAAAPALAQPPSGADQSKPVNSAEPVDVATDMLARNDGSQSAPVETEEELARRWEREQAIYSHISRPSMLAILPVTVFEPENSTKTHTPLPPPCEPPVPRSPPHQPDPPAPAPCPIPR